MNLHLTIFHIYLFVIGKLRGWDDLTRELHFRVMCHSPQMIDIDAFSPPR